VRARLVVIRRISGKNSPQVHLAKDYHLIQALAAQCADQTFSTAIIYNTFNVQRHLISRKTLRQFRAEATEQWRQAAAAA